MWGMWYTHSPFSLQPQLTSCVPYGTHATDGFKCRLKKISRRLFHLSGDKYCLKNSRCRCFGHSFSNHLQPQNLPKPAPSPVGEGWGEGILRISATFLNTLTVPIQALRLVALSLALSHGREDVVAVGIKGSVRKTGCSGCFFIFQTI